METFSKQIELPVDCSEAFAWHERPGALDRLIPPWERVRVLKRSAGMDVGSQVLLEQALGPLRMKWLAEHMEYQPGKRFRDRQVSGPFSHWDHVHEFTRGENGCVLHDKIEYQAPGGRLGQWLAGGYVRSKIAEMFAYRHRTTEADLAARKKYGEHRTMQIAVTGASGLVGSELLPLLTTAGHQVVSLVRREAGDGEVRWDPRAEAFDASALDGVHAVVHLAGDNIGKGRWNDAKKKLMRDSRVKATRTLCEGLAKISNPPKTLVCASAIGFFGERGDDLLDEEESKGEGYLADLVSDWEDATAPAREAGIRVVNLRFGVLLSPKDGALAKMLTPFKMCVGGKMGSGKQYWSWLSLDDAAAVVLHALMCEELSGPVNAVAPDAPTNLEFTKTLGKVLGRPTIFPMPGFMARLALGEMADALLLTSSRVVPRKLQESGYEFRNPTLEGALRHLLGRTL